MVNIVDIRHAEIKQCGFMKDIYHQELHLLQLLERKCFEYPYINW